MVDLPTVTLVCADCLNVERAIRAMERSRSGCNFGAVKLLTSLETDYPFKVPCQPLTTHLDYSIFMLKRIHEFIDTPHMLVVQYDGYVLNAEAWNNEWLNYSYIGPLFIHRHFINDRSVGSGGFSFRSKSIMARVDSLLPPWDCSAAEYQKGLPYYEDGIIALLFRDRLQSEGFTYAPPVEASKFAQGGNCDPGFYVSRPFGFHGNWPNINQSTGFVDAWPWPPDHL